MNREREPRADLGRRATIADVAAHAGVSVTTVSHVLSSRRPVAAETRQRVRDSIQQLGFRPNAIARSLQSQRTQTVAIIVPNIAHVAYPKMARGASEVLRPLGYQVALYDTDSNSEIQQEVLRTIADRMTDGAILFGFNMSAHDAEILTDVGIPFVNGGITSEPVGAWDSVASAQRLGIVSAVLHLAERYTGQVGFLGGPRGDGPAETREAGYRDALRVLGREADESIIRRAEYSLQGGRGAMEDLLEKGGLPRSFACANDLIAIGAMAVARGHGLRIPEDVAFTGFDNDEADLVVDPPLTSIEGDLHGQGRSCAQLLVERMSRAYTGAPRRVVLETDLIIRASSG